MATLLARAEGAAVTTYFFHLRSPDLLLEDCEGTDLPSLHDALLQVLEVRSELAADPEGSVDDLAFEVTDSSGRLLLRVPLSQSPYGLPSAGPLPLRANVA